MKYKLVCFDLDGTVLDIEDYIWNNLHDAFGVPKQYRDKYWDLFRSKEISYQEWFDSDIAQWKKRGITRKDFVREIRKLRLMKGATQNTKRTQEARL